jgi:protein-S-isoprenylcysteine O-methyltransferase Ste14
LGSALFFVIAPLVLAGFVPWWVTQWEFRPAFFGLDLTRILGGILIIVGVPGVVDSFARFALEGLGTPAPIAPPQKLVVTGLYRYVRNPIYIAVVAAILVRPFCLVTGVSSGTARYSGFFFMSLWCCTKNRRSSKHSARSTRAFGLMCRAGFRG